MTSDMKLLYYCLQHLPDLLFPNLLGKIAHDYLQLIFLLLDQFGSCGVFESLDGLPALFRDLLKNRNQSNVTVGIRLASARRGLLVGRVFAYVVTFTACKQAAPCELQTASCILFTLNLRSSSAICLTTSCVTRIERLQDSLLSRSTVVPA